MCVEKDLADATIDFIIWECEEEKIRVLGVGFRERERCVEKDLVGATIDFVIQKCNDEKNRV